MAYNLNTARQTYETRTLILETNMFSKMMIMG